MMDYLAEVPFDVSRKSLYHPAELYEGFTPDDESSYCQCFDSIIYQRYTAMGQHTNNVKELLARTLHDHSIHTALARFFKTYDHRRCVGVMGGHALLRTDKIFRDIALLSQRLTQEGFVMLSGGGPGAMEATHLGAWMAGFTSKDMEDALETMLPAPSFRDAGWLQTAFSVIDSCMRICRCRASGKTSTRRSTESAADCVWSVPKTRWPVSAAVSAVSMVSRSRISPTRMMSGSSRRMARRPSAKLTVSRPISR